MSKQDYEYIVGMRKMLGIFGIALVLIQEIVIMLFYNFLTVLLKFHNLMFGMLEK